MTTTLFPKKTKNTTDFPTAARQKTAPHRSKRRSESWDCSLPKTRRLVGWFQRGMIDPTPMGLEGPGGGFNHVTNPCRTKMRISSKWIISPNFGVKITHNWNHQPGFMRHFAWHGKWIEFNPNIKYRKSTAGSVRERKMTFLFKGQMFFRLGMGYWIPPNIHIPEVRGKQKIPPFERGSEL